MLAEKIRTRLGKGNAVFAQETWLVLLINAVICSVVAVFVWVSLPQVGNSGLLSSWVYAQCIGQLICIGFLVYTPIQEAKTIDSRISYFIVYPTIVLLGFIVGKSIAAYIMSTPAEYSSNGPAFWVTLLVTICVSLFAMWLFSSREKMAHLKMVAAEESARAAKAKLSMLQAQIEPHMLFNTLSNLRSLMHTDTARATLMLDNLVDYLRATLASSMHESALLKDEFILLENYLSLMNIRMGQRLEHDLHLPTELEGISVPILILQPIVENAIKHGIEPSAQGGTISVYARADESCVAVEVVDTGVGYHSDDNKISGGFGLHSVRERLQTEQSLYEVLSIKSPLSNDQQGTSVTVRLPLSNAALSKDSQ